MLEDVLLMELINKAQTGDTEAQEMVIKHNLNLVRSIVHRFVNRGYEWDDLFQIGCIGLVKAVERFDMSYSVKFSTYAVPMIIGEIRRFIRDDNPVKVSRSIKELAFRIHRTQESLQGKLGREPTISEIAEALSLESNEVVAALEAVQPLTSIYDQAYHDHNNETIHVLDRLKAETNDECFEKLVLKDVIARLPEREKTIIYMRFFEDKTQAEIAEKVGLSQVQVSRVEKQALKMIREILEQTS